MIACLPIVMYGIVDHLKPVYICGADTVCMYLLQSPRRINCAPRPQLSNTLGHLFSFQSEPKKGIPQGQDFDLFTSLEQRGLYKGRMSGLRIRLAMHCHRDNCFSLFALCLSNNQHHPFHRPYNIFSITPCTPGQNFLGQDLATYPRPLIRRDRATPIWGCCIRLMSKRPH